MQGESRGFRAWIAPMVGCLAVVMLLLVPAGASAFVWPEWVEAEEVTETSATIAVYVHPRWPITHYKLFVSTPEDQERTFGLCSREPERCDANFVPPEKDERQGTIVQKSPYEIVEIDVPVPGPLFESPLQPAKLYELNVGTYGEGEEANAPEVPTNAGNWSGYEGFETPGALGPEEQTHKALIEKESTKRAKQHAASKKQRERVERMLANLKKKSERSH